MTDNDADISANNSLSEDDVSSVLHASRTMPVFPSSQVAGDDTSEIGNLHPSSSFSSIAGIYPYTRENRPKRKPFHHSSRQRLPNERDSQLYARFRYYSRLRAPAAPHDHALIIPDHVMPMDLFLFYIPGRSLRDAEGKQSSYITILAIWNTMMGTSLLTMPWAFGQAGFVAGIAIMLLQLMVCLYTACKLLQLQKTMGVEGDMHELNYLFRSLWPGSLGKFVEGCAITFSVVTIMGALIVYWVLMSNFLYNTGEFIYRLTHESSGGDNVTDLTMDVVCPPNNTFTHWLPDVTAGDEPDPDAFHKFWKQDLSVPLLLLIPFVFLLSIKNTAIFTYFNSLGAVSVMAIYLFVIVQAFHWGFNFSLSDVTDPLYIPFYKPTFMALSGTLSLAYFIHNCVITILKGNRHPENNVRDLSIAYLLVASTYIPVAMIFYLSFPLPKYCIVANFLDNFPPHNQTLAVARIFLLFQMLTVFPLLNYFLRSQLLAYLFGPSEATHSWRRILPLNAFVLAFCVAVAIFYPNIGVIIRWVGALAGLAFIFVLPCISDIQAHYRKGTLGVGRVIFSSSIICLGVANFIAQFFS